MNVKIHISKIQHDDLGLQRHLKISGWTKELINVFHEEFNFLHLNVVGHNLGGQVSGIIQRSVLSLSQNKRKLLRFAAAIHNIEYFCEIMKIRTERQLRYHYSILQQHHRSANEATLVDIIHTDTASKYVASINTDFVLNVIIRFELGYTVIKDPWLFGLECKGL